MFVSYYYNKNLKVMKAVKENTPKVSENKKQHRQAKISSLYQYQAENSYSQSQESGPLKQGMSESTNPTSIPPVHSSNSTYSRGSEIVYKKLQESLENTNDLSNPETRQKEKDYKDTLSIPELRNYHDIVSSNKVLSSGIGIRQSDIDLERKNGEENLTNKHGSSEKLVGFGTDKQDPDPITRLIVIKKGQKFNNKLIQNQDDLNRFAEFQMGITRPLNWTKVFSDADVQKMVANGSTVRYTINIKVNDIQKEIDTLSTSKKHFIIDTNDSADYIQNLRILDLLKQLSDEEIADYQSKVSAQYNNPATIEASLKAYIDNQKQKRNDQDKLESVKTKLFGLEDIYKRYIDFSKSSPSITYPSSTGIPITIENEGYELEKKQLTEDLIANGFEGGIPEFKNFIERYEVGFENKTAQIGIDYLKQYKHFLYVEQEKLSDERYLESLLAKLKSSGAKQKFDDANSAKNTVSNLSFADKPYSFEIDFKDKMRTNANQKVSEAKNNIKDFKTLTPLVIDEGFDSEGFAQCTSTSEIKIFLQNYITRKNEMANNAITKITNNPEHIYELDTLFTTAKQQEQVEENSIYNSILNAKYEKIHQYDVLKAVGLGILSLAIIIVTWGAATPVVIAGGILSAGISIGFAYEAIDEYKTKKDFHDVGLLSDDPSMIWVVLAIAGAALDATALAAVLRSAKPIAAAAKTFNDAEDAAVALTKLEESLVKIEGLNAKVQANIVKQAELTVEFRTAAQNFLRAGTTINSGINPAALPELIHLAEIGIKQGILSFKNFLLELKLMKVIKSVENLTDEELKILKEAFEKAKSGNKVIDKAQYLIKQAKENEGTITELLSNQTSKLGGKMEGLDFRIKSLESLTRKISRDGIQSNFNDVLRYTTIFEPEFFTMNVKNMIEQIKSRGYKILNIKNTFKERAVYMGINVQIESPTGQIFELQFHTPQSFNVKQNINHKLYEESRIIGQDTKRNKNLINQMRFNSSKIEIPEEVNTIK